MKLQIRWCISILVAVMIAVVAYVLIARRSNVREVPGLWTISPRGGIEELHDNIASVAFSTDGRVLVTVSDSDTRGRDPQTAKLVDVATGKVIGTIGGERVACVSFSPDGKFLACGIEGGWVEVFSWPFGATSAGQPSRRPEGWTLGGYRSRLCCLAFSTDSRTLAVGTYEGEISIWDIFSGRKTQILRGGSAAIRAISWSTDGTLLATAGYDQMVKVWNVSTGVELRSLPGFLVAFSPDGRSLATSGPGNRVQIWDAAGTSQLGELDVAIPDFFVQSIAWSPDGKTVATGGGDGRGDRHHAVQLWDAASRKAFQTFAFCAEGSGGPARISSMAFSPDGKTLAFGTGGFGQCHQSVRFLDVGSGTICKTLGPMVSQVSCVAWSPDAKMLAGGKGHNSVDLWEASSGKRICTLTPERDCDPGRISSLTFSPTSRFLAAGSTGGDLTLWSVASRQGILVHTSDFKAVLGLAFSPDGRMLAAGGEDCTVRLWDFNEGGTASGRKPGDVLLAGARVLSGHTGNVTSLAFSPAGTHLASAGEDRTVRLWEIPGARALATLTGHLDSVTCVVFSPDGKIIASGSKDHTVRLWEVPTGKEICTLPRQALPVCSLSFGPQGKGLVVESHEQAVIFVDGKTGELRRSEMFVSGSDGRPSNLSGSSPLGAELSNDLNITSWDLATNQVTAALAIHPPGVHSAAFSVDGRTMAVCCEDGTVKIWNVATGEKVLTIGDSPQSVCSVAFSADGTTLASCGGDTVRLWDAASGTEIRSLSGHSRMVTSVVCSPDGRTFATASKDGTVKLWDVRTGEGIRTLDALSRSVFSISFSPDGGKLAGSGGSGNPWIMVWDVKTGGEIRTLPGLVGEYSLIFGVGPIAPSISRASAYSVAFSPDGQLLASGHYGSVKLWNVPTWDENRVLTDDRSRSSRGEGTPAFVYSLAFSPDGRMLATSQGPKVILWDVGGGQKTRNLLGHTGVVESLAFSPDGRLLASGSHDMTVKVWEVSSGSEIRALAGHSLMVTSVAFSPDGKTLASAGWDETVKLWDVATGLEMRALRHLSEIAR